MLLASRATTYAHHYSGIVVAFDWVMRLSFCFRYFALVRIGDVFRFLPTCDERHAALTSSLGLIGLCQGFSNFWCYGAHEEIDHNLRSPAINFINAVIASLDSCEISQISILISLSE